MKKAIRWLAIYLILVGIFTFLLSICLSFIYSFVKDEHAGSVSLVMFSVSIAMMLIGIIVGNVAE